MSTTIIEIPTHLVKQFQNSLDGEWDGFNDTLQERCFDRETAQLLGCLNEVYLMRPEDFKYELDTPQINVMIWLFKNHFESYKDSLTDVPEDTTDFRAISEYAEVKQRRDDCEELHELFCRHKTYTVQMTGEQIGQLLYALYRADDSDPTENEHKVFQESLEFLRNYYMG